MAQDKSGDKATVAITLVEVEGGWRLSWGNESLTIPRLKAEAMASHILGRPVSDAAKAALAVSGAS